MNPPSLSTFQSYFQTMLQMLRRPAHIFTQQQSSNPSSGGIHPMRFLGRIRHMSTQEMVATAVVAAQVLGFFTVGEIIGRFKLVGYRGEKEEHH
ncbi:MAG: hypothetical protein M1816_006678 [Peltula sp. TS41687]|nr:MAG: hypothetical protein M1816_006678 [Peltula sp. TS41687]